jgi:tetratricopeptide (TPR) repeat protein
LTLTLGVFPNYNPTTQMPVFYAPPIQMSAILDPRLGRIRALQQVYSALQTDLPLLEERINLLRAVIIDREASSLAGSGVNPFLVQYRYDLGVALYERFLHVNEAGDLVQAEKHLKQALVGLPPKISPGPHSVLGSVLRERAFIASSCSLSDEALGLHRQTFITNADMCDLERARRHRELGLTLRIHFVNAGQTHCLMECIQQLKTSMSLFMRLGIFDHACSAALARAFTHLYDMETSKAHLSEASSISAAMLVQCPSDHRDFYRVVWSVAAVNRFLAWFCDDISLLNVDILRTALADAPSGWATLLTIELCEALRLPFVKQGSEEALSEAIAQVITLSESLDPEAAHWDGLQASLGNVLSLRFRMTGSADDIDNAAHATEMALARSDTRSPIHLSRLTRLALCRETQYRAFGDMAHLNDCIALHARITRLAPSDSAHRALAKHNLVDALKQRAEATGCLMDLDRAIELIPKSTTCLTFDHPNASTGLSQVGDVFLLRFERTGLLDDLERATTYYQQAARAWETSSSRGFEYHNVMNSYSKVLRIRYDVLHEVDSMTQALAQQKQLVDDLPVAHADRAHVLCGLAQTLICANRGHEDLEQGLKHLLDSLSNDYCPAYRRLKDAANVLTCLAKRGPQLNHVSNLKLSLVFSTTIALLPQVASFGLDPRARLAVISDSGQLTAQGASHAISINRHELALEMLEAGRSVFWAQGLRLRTSFTNLPSKIGDRLTALTSALNQPMADFGGEGPGKDRELARRRRLGDEFKAVVAEARLLPGMEDLLQNSSFASLARAAQQHPIVVFVASKNSGHAIIILKNAQCVHVNLEKAKGSTLKALVHHIEMHTRHARSSRGICIMQRTTPSATDVYRELWTTVMLPIVTALGWPVSSGVHPIFGCLIFVGD